MESKHKSFWRILLFITILVASFAVIRFVSAWSRYHYCQYCTVASDVRWEEVPLRNSRYKLCVKYTFEVAGEIVNHTYLYKEKYPSKDAIGLEIIKRKSENLLIWHNVKKNIISTPLRAFPFKETVEMLVCFVILLYFLILKNKFSLQSVSI